MKFIESVLEMESICCERYTDYQYSMIVRITSIIMKNACRHFIKGEALPHTSDTVKQKLHFSFFDICIHVFPYDWPFSSNEYTLLLLAVGYLKSNMYTDQSTSLARIKYNVRLHASVLIEILLNCL